MDSPHRPSSKRQTWVRRALIAGLAVALAAGVLAGLFPAADGQSALGDPYRQYRVRDSTEPGGPQYRFFDISPTGRMIALGDEEVSAERAIGFTTRFYGELYTRVRIGSNGFLTFIASNSTGVPAPTPTAALPNALVAAYFADLDPTAGGQVQDRTVKIDGIDVYIVQWTDIKRYGSDERATFQTWIVNGMDDIQVHYKTARLTPGNAAFVGIEDAAGTTGLLYRDASVAQDLSGLAVRFSYALPSAAFSVPRTQVLTGEALVFTDESRFAFDPEYKDSVLITSWIWDFGDGTTATGRGPHTHAYTDNGGYVVTLTVEDERHETSNATRTITVANRAPVAAFAYEANPEGPLPEIRFTDLSQDLDGRLTWAWDFGDGETSDEQNPAHPYAQPGVYAVTLMVTDDDGVEDRFIMAISTNRAPTLNLVPDKTAEEGATLQFVVTAHDPDGDALQFTLRGLEGTGARLARTGDQSALFVWDVQEGQAGDYAGIVIEARDMEQAARTGFAIVVVDTVPPPPADRDADNDGIPDVVDNCPSRPNGAQADADRDGAGDACDDTDDRVPIDPDADTDGDGALDGYDDCRTDANPDQADLDFDGIGDACDDDADGDGYFQGSDAVVFFADNCPDDSNPQQVDRDGDGVGDACDEDPLHAPGATEDGAGTPGEVRTPTEKNAFQRVVTSAAFGWTIAALTLAGLAALVIFVLLRRARA